MRTTQVAQNRRDSNSMASADTLMRPPARATLTFRNDAVRTCKLVERGAD